MNSEPTPRSALVWLLLVLAVTCGVYAPSLGNGFAMDDRRIAKSAFDDGRPNPMVAELQPIGEYFGSHYWRGHKSASNLYRPVTVLSYALCRRLAGRTPSEAGEALPQHLANVLLHLLATLLVYALVVAVRAPPLAGVVAAAVFGLHAIHSEVVAGIAGRAELLAFCFGALGLVVLHRGLDARGWRRSASLGGAAVLAFLALCSKESAVAWLGVWPLHRLVRARTGGAGPRPAVSAVLVALPALALFLWLRHGALAPLAADHRVLYLVNPLAHAGTGSRMLTAVAVAGYGVYKTLVPFSLASDYGVAFFPILETAADWRFLLAAAVLAAIGAAGIFSFVRRPLVFLGTAVFFGFLLPVSNLPFAIGTIFGERLYYTPSLGLALVAAHVWSAHSGTLASRRVIAAAGGAWLLACSVVIVSRNHLWNDNCTLFVEDARTQPRVARLQLNASVCVEDPRPYLERALKAFPQYPAALLNYGGWHLKRGNVQRAERRFRQALASPHLVVEREACELHRNLLGIALAQGRTADGWQHLEAALATAGPADWPGLLEVGGFLLRIGRRGDAVRLLERLADEARAPGGVRATARERAARLR